MNRSTTGVVVVGGGMAGLSAARTLNAAGVPWVLLERGSLGGVVRTEEQDGFLMDAGPDSFITTKPWALQLCKELGLEDQLVDVPLENRSTSILHRGKLTPFPQGFLLGVPGSLGALLAAPLFSWPGKIRMAGDLVIRPADPRVDESIADFVRRRLGREALHRLLGSLLAGIHAGDPERLSVHATFPLLTRMEKQHGSLILGVLEMMKKRPRGPAPSPFRSLRGGMKQLVDAVAGDLPAGSVHPHTQVTGLTHNPGGSGGWVVHSSGREPIACQGLILAVPAPVAASLLGRHNPALAEDLREIPAVSTASAFLAWPKKDLPAQLVGTGFLIPAHEGRRILAVTYTSNKFPGRAPEGMALVRVFFGGRRDEAQVALSDEELESIARGELKDLVGIEAPPVMTRVFRWPKSNPQYEVGHLARMEKVRLLERKLGVVLAGSFYGGVGMPDAIRQGREAAERVLPGFA